MQISASSSGTAEPRREAGGPRFSIVVAVFNEADNVAPVTAEILRAAAPLGPFELIYVDDGSTTRPPERLRVLRDARRRDPRAAPRPALRQDGGADHRRSCAARAPWVVTMDGDGQDDAAEVPRLLELAWAGGEPSPLVAGIRTTPARSAGRGASRQNSRTVCGRRCCTTTVRIPPAASRRSAATCSCACLPSRACTGFCRRCSRPTGIRWSAVPVNHRPRLAGQSKYTQFRPRHRRLVGHARRDLAAAPDAAARPRRRGMSRRMRRVPVWSRLLPVSAAGAAVGWRCSCRARRACRRSIATSRATLQATAQMFETGNFVDIRFQDQPRYLQPAGIYWLQAASVALLSAPGRARGLGVSRAVADRRDGRGAADGVDRQSAVRRADRLCRGGVAGGVADPRGRGADGQDRRRAARRRAGGAGGAGEDLSRFRRRPGGAPRLGGGRLLAGARRRPDAEGADHPAGRRSARSCCWRSPSAASAGCGSCGRPGACR